MSTNYNPRIVTDGLVLALDAANSRSYSGTGTTWSDLSGNGNTGTLTNGPTYNSANAGSIVFDGVNDRIDLAQIDNTTELSLEGWHKFTASSFPSFSGIVSKDVSGNRIFQLNLMTGKLQSHLGAGMTASTAVPLNTWYHFGFTSSSVGNSILYVNAVSVAVSGGQIAANSANIPIHIGGYNNGIASGGSKEISRVNMYNRALTAAEVAQNFNATRGRYGI